MAPILERYERVIFADEPDAEATESVHVGIPFLFALHEAEFIEFYRQFAQKVAGRSRGSLATRGLPAHEYRKSRLRADEFSLVRREGGQFSLNVIVPTVSAKIDHHTFLQFRPKGNANVSFRSIHAEGTKDELADFLLLEWERNQSGDGSNAIFARLLAEVSGGKIDPELETWQTWRRSQLGMETHQEWQRHIGYSGNTHLQSRTLSRPYIYHGDMAVGLLRIARDPDILPVHRAQAIGWYVKIDTEKGALSAMPEMLADLIELLDDTSPVSHDAIIESFGWEAVSILGPLLRDAVRKSSASNGKKNLRTRTISQIVHERLQELTGVSDVAASRAAWETWFADAMATGPERANLPTLHKLSMPNGGTMELRIRKGEPHFTVGGKELDLPMCF